MSVFTLDRNETPGESASKWVFEVFMRKVSNFPNFLINLALLKHHLRFVLLDGMSNE